MVRPVVPLSWMARMACTSEQQYQTREIHHRFPGTAAAEGCSEVSVAVAGIVAVGEAVADVAVAHEARCTSKWC